MDRAKLAPIILSLLFAASTGFAQLPSVRVQSEAGGPIPVDLLDAPPGVDLSGAGKVWYILPTAQDKMLHVDLTYPDAFPDGTSVTIADGQVPGNYSIGSPQLVGDRTIRVPVEVLTQQTLAVPLKLRVNGQARDPMYLYVARPPFGWMSLACENRTPVVIVRNPGQPVSVEIPEAVHPSELLSTPSRHRVLVNDVEQQNALRLEDNRWKVQFTPPNTDQAYRVETVFRTRPYWSTNLQAWMTNQSVCKRVAIVDREAPTAVLQTRETEPQVVRFVYPQDNLVVRLEPRPSGQVDLQKQTYPVVTTEGTRVGELIVSGTPGAVAAEGTLVMSSPPPGVPLFVADPAASSRLYRLDVQPAPTPRVTSAQIFRAGESAPRQMWSNDEFVLVLRGAGLNETLKISDANVLGITASPAVATGTEWRATLQTGALPLNEARVLALTDGRVVFPTTATTIDVVENRTPRKLSDVLSVSGNPWEGMNAGLVREQRRELGDLSIQMEPAPAESRAGTQYLLLQAEVHPAGVDTVFSTRRDFILRPGVQESVPIEELFPSGVENRLLSEPGTVVRLRVAHDRAKHPGVSLSDSAYVRIANSRPSFVQFEVGAVAGAMLLRHSMDSGRTSGLADPLVGAGPRFELVRFDDRGRPKRVRYNISFPLLSATVDQKNAVAQPAGEGATAEEPKTTFEEKPAGILAILPGVSLDLAKVGSLSRISVGISGGVGWDLAGGRPHYFLFLSPGGLAIPAWKF